VFLCTPHNNIFAIDADSGKQLWKAEVNSTADAWERCRGVRGHAVLVATAVTAFAPAKVGCTSGFVESKYATPRQRSQALHLMVV
jgi:glucose dehydrogenase